MTITIIQALAAIQLIFVAVATDTPNFKSMILFRFISLILGILLGFQVYVEVFHG